MATARRGSALPKARILDMEEYTESQNWLVFGETGAGKTPWTTLLPKTLVIAADHQGTISAKRAGSTAKVFKVYRWEDMETIYKHLRASPGRYDWVVVDTVTMLQVRLLRSILEYEHKRNPNKRDLFIPAIQDHQRWQNMLKNMVTDFCELPFNTVWTAQEMERENAEGDPVVWPFLPGGKQGHEMSSWFCSQMHVVAHMKVTMRGKGDDRRPVRTILTDKRPPYQARDRYGVLPKTAVVMDGDKTRTTFAELTAMIDEAPPEVKARAARRVSERDDRIGLEGSVDPDEAAARPRNTRRRRAS
jgi:AAA domain